MMNQRLIAKVDDSSGPDRRLQFESNSSHFHSKTYDNPRGEIRARLLSEWLAEWLDGNPKCDQIIDIGCGDGRFALELVANRPRLRAVLSDPSRPMIMAAEANVAALGLSSRVKTADLGLERIRELPISQDAIILCHGVLNWVNDPEFCATHLAGLCEESGAALSLLFGNRIGHLIAFARSGLWEECASLVNEPATRLPSELSREGLRLFDLIEILDWLKVSEDEQLRVRGLRCISDYLPESELRERFDDLIAIERKCAENRRFLSIANMVHILRPAKRSR